MLCLLILLELFLWYIRSSFTLVKFPTVGRMRSKHPRCVRNIASIENLRVLFLFTQASLRSTEKPSPFLIGPDPWLVKIKAWIHCPFIATPLKLIHSSSLYVIKSKSPLLSLLFQVNFDPNDITIGINILCAGFLMMSASGSLKHN